MYDELRLSRELKKIQREIKIHGDTVNVSREAIDKYGESAGNKRIWDIQGLFHYQTSYMQRQTQDGTDTHKKSKPMLLIDAKYMWDIDTMLNIGDIINGHYEVIAIDDIGLLGIVVDVSLEVKNDGEVV